MTRAGLLAIVFLAMSLVSTFSLVAHGGGESVTVRGEVLDLACYIAHEGKGEEHAKCAESCVKSGQPMGLLAADGTVYLLYASHRDATAYEETKSHAGKQVELQGKLAGRSGMKGIEVAAVKGL